MTQSNKNDDFDLDALFQEARIGVPTPNPALFDQIIADAQSVLDEPLSETSKPVSSPPWWRQLWIDIGGWPTVTGLATAGIFGVWIGMSSDLLSTQAIAPDTNTVELSDPFSGLDLAMLEG